MGKVEVFIEHKSKVLVCTMSPSGSWVASGDIEGNILIWGYPNMIIKNTLRMGNRINDIRWSGDSRRIIACGDGSTEYGKIFNYDSTNAVYKQERITKCILSCDWNTKKLNRVVVADEDKTVSFYKGIPFSRILYTTKHTRYPNVVRFSPDGNTYVTVGSDSRIVLYNGDTGEYLNDINDNENCHKGSIFGCSWNQNSNEIVTSSADNTVKVWNINDNKVTKTWKINNKTGPFDDQQISAFWAPNSLLIGSISLSGTLNLFDINKDEPINTIYGHSSSVRGCLLLREKNILLTSDSDGHIFSWDITTGIAKILNLSTYLSSNCNIMIKDTSNTYIYMACNGGILYKLNLDTLELQQITININNATFNDMYYGNNKSIIVYCTSKGEVGIIKDEKIICNIQLKETTSVCLNDDEDTIYVTGGTTKRMFKISITGDSDSNMTLKKDKETDEIFNLYSNLVTYSGTYVASIQHDHVVVHDTELDTIKTYGWSYHNARITSLHWSPNSKYLLSTSLDKQIILWTDCENFKPKNQLFSGCFTSGILFADFIDNNSIIAVGSDGFVKVLKWE